MAATQEAPAVYQLRHPHYVVNELNWLKWRLCFQGGSEFLKKYLRKLSKREDDQEFGDRRAISYVPAFAKRSVNKVKNAVFARMHEVIRYGGPTTYQDACKGTDNRGVDLMGRSMSSFLGSEILPELLTMARVGVWVDMPQLTGPTLAEKGEARPYCYWYKAEDIRSWSINIYGDPTDFQALLLRDSQYDINKRWLLPYETTIRYRYVWIDPEDGLVRVQFWNQGFDQQGRELWTGDDPVTLAIRKIPFVIFELSDSLLMDVADYQIALMNLASTGINYAVRSNFPLYTEQVDWRTESPHLKGANNVTQSVHATNVGENTVYIAQDLVREVRVGVNAGRQYPSGLERPGFIHPSPEPLKVAMEKEEQMKREIEELVLTSLSSLQPTRTNPRDTDETTADAGLNYIALELEHGERKIAEYWAMYEGSEDQASVQYPTNYTLLSETDRRAHAEFLKDLLPNIPSLTFQRQVCKQIIEYTVAHRVDPGTLSEMFKEVDTSPVVHGDPKVIASDIQQGLVSLETASKARGYPAGEVAKASQDHAERIARIAAAQAPGQGYGATARGVNDLGTEPNAATQEKTASQKETANDPVPRKKTRGENV